METLDLDAMIPTSETGFKVNGEWFPYASRYAWSLLERVRFDRGFKRVIALEQIENPTEEESAEYAWALTDLMSIIAPTAPSLSIEQQGVVLLDFLGKNRSMTSVLAEMRMTEMATMNAIGGRSLPDSPGSTE